MLTTSLRGKASGNEVFTWSVYIHDTAYENGDYAYEVERVLKRIARSKKMTAELLSVYSTADVYRLYYSGQHLKLADELYTKANAVLSRFLNR